MNDIIGLVKKIYLKYPYLSIAYIIWFSLNFIILFISDKEGKAYFYPFQKNTATSGTFTYYQDGTRPHSLIHAYDFSEFIVFILAPLFILLIYTLLKQNTSKAKP